MPKPRARVLAVVAVLAGALFSVPSTSIAETNDAAPTALAQQRFILLQTDPNSPKMVIVAKGAIHAQGVDTPTGPRKDRFVFPDGKLVIKHKPKSDHDHFDPVTCHGVFVERGTWRVLKGTGDYRTASGGGTYRVRGEIVGCDENKPPKILMVRVRAVGDIGF